MVTNKTMSTKKIGRKNAPPVWILGIHVQIYPKNVLVHFSICDKYFQKTYLVEYTKKQRIFEWHATFLLLAWDANDFLPGFHSSPGISKPLDVTGNSENIKSDSFSGFLKFISTRYLHHNKTTGLFQSIILQPHFAGWCLSLEANPQKGTYNNSRRTKFSTLTLKIFHKPRKACIFPPAPIRHIGSVPALDSPLQAIRSPLPVLQKNLCPRIHESDSETKWTGFPRVFFIASH